MPGCSSQGYETKLCINTGNPLYSGSTRSWNDFAVSADNTGLTRFDFNSETLGKTESFLNTSGIRGTRSQSEKRTRIGTQSVAGSIIFNPSPNMLDVFLPLILGKAEATDVFEVGEVLFDFGVMFDRVVERFTLEDVKVSRAVFRGGEGDLLELELEMVAKKEITGQTFPPEPPAANGIAISATDADLPYTFMDSDNAGTSRLVIEGTPLPINSFQLTIDNLIETRFRNSITATCIHASDRLVTLATNHPWTSTERSSLFGALRPTSDINGSLEFANGSRSVLFTFANLQAPDNTPSVDGKTEIGFDMQMIALETATDKEIVITNVNS